MKQEHAALGRESMTEQETFLEINIITEIKIIYFKNWEDITWYTANTQMCKMSKNNKHSRLL